jgi:ABC-type Mn2+/Zn2+ transport system permease subunit
MVSGMKGSFRAKLLLAWGLGTVLNLIAITASYFLDLPTGYTVVALYAFSGIVFTLVRGVAGPRDTVVAMK